MRPKQAGHPDNVGWSRVSPRELGVLAVVCLIWGFHFIVIKLVTAEIPPIFYAAIRMSLVAACLSPFLRWRAGNMRIVLSAAICLGCLNYALMFSGLYYSTASIAALVMELHIPFATVLSVLFLGDRIGLRRLSGITLAFVGVVVIALGNTQGESNAINVPLGIGLVAAGAFVEAVGAILVKKSSGFKPIELLSWFALVGSVGLWGLTFLIENGQRQALAESDMTLVVGAVLYSAIGGSIIGHTAYYWLLQRLPVSTVAPSILVTTLIAVFFGVVLLGEPFGLREIAGGIMVLAGVALVILRNAAKQDIKAPMTEPGALP